MESLRDGYFKNAVRMRMYFRSAIVMAGITGVVLATSPLARAEDGAISASDSDARAPSVPAELPAQSRVVIDVSLPAWPMDVVSATEALPEGGPMLPASEEPPVDSPTSPAEPPTSPAEPPETTAEAPAARAEAPVVPAAQDPVDPPSEAPAESPAAQTGAANLNVSVRIDSPGDAGEVMQANSVAVAADPATRPAAPPSPPSAPAPSDSERYQVDTGRYQGSTNHSAASSGPDDPTWRWNWSGDCAPNLPIPQISPPVEAGTGSAPRTWVWNWYWDCAGETNSNGNITDESTGQYHPVVSQYQPINASISIRIRSGGSDGAVIQTNLATIAFPIVEMPGSATSSQPEASSRSQQTAAPVVAPPVPDSSLPLSTTGDTTAVVPPAEEADEAEADRSAVYRGTAVAPATGLEPGGASTEGSRCRPSSNRPIVMLHPIPLLKLAQAESAAPALRVIPPVTASAPAVASDPRPASRRVRANAIPRRPVTPAAPAGPSVAAIAPPTGVSSSGAGLLLASLLVPVGVAVLDLLRRLRLGLALLHPEHVDSFPERPG